jgi:hypothetical protein
LKYNNQSGIFNVEIVIVTMMITLIFAFIAGQFMPHKPILTTEVLVLGVEPVITTTPSRGKDTEHFHCDILVQEKDASKQTKFRFNVDSKTESKIYCDALDKDEKYLFTHYEKENSNFGIVIDYKLIAKP